MPKTFLASSLYRVAIAVQCVGTIFAFAACAGLSLPPLAFADAPDQGDVPADADAVVLLQHRQYLSQNPPSRPGTTDVQEHRVLKILTEAAFSEGASHIFVPSGSTLLDLRARTISPSGEITPVDVSTILSSTYSTGDKDGDSGDTRSFQFPRVEVGSILETISTIRHPRPWWTISDDVAEKYPVRLYQVEIVLDKFAKPDLFVNNATPKLSHVTRGDGSQMVSFELRDVAPLPRDPYRPSNRELGPWWIYRTIEWRYPRGVADGVSTWARAVGAYHSKLIDGEDVDGFAVRGADSCGDDTMCIADAALKTLREDVELSSFAGFATMRPLKEVKGARSANNNELALALWKMLKDRGVDARLALTSRTAYAPITETFPASAWLNHALIWVPGQPGASSPSAKDDPGTFIDPSCESCPLGTLPTWSHGARAIVLTKGGGEYGDVLKASPFQTIHGTVSPPPTTTRVATMRVDALGDVEMEFTTTERHAEAVDRLITDADDSDDDAKAAAKLFVTSFSKNGELREYERWRCDRPTATCTQRLVIGLPGFATVSDDGDSVIVPVSGLVTSVEKSLAVDDGDPRRAPIRFTTDEHIEDTLTVIAPAGWEVSPGTRPVGTRKTDGLTLSLAMSSGENSVTLKRDYRLQRGTHPVNALARFSATLADARTFRREVLTMKKKKTPTTTPVKAPATASSR